MSIRPLLFCGMLAIVGFLMVAAAAAAADLVDGNLILINPNGAWSWYQDERAAVDPARGKLLVGSLANRFGPGGRDKDGDVEVTQFDLATGVRRTDVLRHGLISYGGGDDHNAPALLVLPDGNYLAMYAGHNNDTFSHFRIFDTQSGTWRPESSFDWDLMPGGSDFATSYSNLFYLSAERRLINIARSDDRSPNIMVSDDFGATWTYGGQLTETANVGYVNGYFKFWSNGVDRIDFIATEHHPRDFNTSIYHGYIQGGKSYDAAGRLVNENVLDQADIPAPDNFTQVFAADTQIDGVRMTRCWTIDLAGYPDGTLAAFFKARADDSDQDHRFFYARFDGREWTATQLGKAGARLFRREEDYTGLGALDPNDPNALYISTTVDPTTGAELARHEIYAGRSADNGRTWTWTAVTRESSRDNMRPIVPAWNENKTALLWWRGSMRSSQNYDAAVVGVIRRKLEQSGPVKYVKASRENTTYGAGTTSAVPSAVGATAAEGATSADSSFPLKTTLTNLEPGTYDLFAFFWAEPGQDSLLHAGLAADQMTLFRAAMSQRAEADHFADPPELTDGPRALYRAYVSRMTVGPGQSIELFADHDRPGQPIQSSRISFDGIGYSPVATVPGP